VCVFMVVSVFVCVCVCGCECVCLFVYVCVYVGARENSLTNCKRNFFNPLTPVAISHIIMDKILFCHGTTAPSEQGTLHYRGFTITLRYTIFDRTPLDE